MMNSRLCVTGTALRCVWRYHHSARRQQRSGDSDSSCYDLCFRICSRNRVSQPSLCLRRRGWRWSAHRPQLCLPNTSPQSQTSQCREDLGHRGWCRRRTRPDRRSILPPLQEIQAPPPGRHSTTNAQPTRISYGRDVQQQPLFPGLLFRAGRHVQPSISPIAHDLWPSLQPNSQQQLRSRSNISHPPIPRPLSVSSQRTHSSSNHLQTAFHPVQSSRLCRETAVHPRRESEHEHVLELEFEFGLASAQRQEQRSEDHHADPFIIAGDR
jgi:hypothetical protein